MNKHLIALLPILCIIIASYGIVVAYDNNLISTSLKFSESYGVQWEMNYGSDPSYGARYEGPQPIGDCDNDGDNELLIGGRDSVLRVMKWSESQQTYEQTHTLHSPFYYIQLFLQRIGRGNGPMDADGFAIGDLTGDGENEIAVSWYATVHKYIGGKYRVIGWNNWIERNGGGSPDCYIGDCDNDGQNELILSCRDWYDSVPEIVVFKWNGFRLVKVADWDVCIMPA